MMPPDYYKDLLSKRVKNLPKKHFRLIEKGRNDNTTFAKISVVIKYTTEFASTLAVYPETAMYLIAARTIEVS